MKFGLAIVAMSVGAAPAAERLSDPDVAGFVIVYEAANAEQSIRELVPQGETVVAWSRMITDQRFVGLASKVSPVRFAGIVGDGLVGSCPGGKAGRIIEFRIDGHPAAQMRADCPRNPATGEPETFLMLLIAGEQDLHSRQVAWRKVPSLPETNWGEEVLARTRLCTPGKTAPGC